MEGHNYNVLNNKSKSASINNITLNNSEVQDPKMIAEIFNNYFVNIGPNLAHDIPNTNIEVRTFLENAQFHTMFLSPVIADEVLALVNKMKPKKGSGFDGITNFLIKKIINEIIEPLTHILNASLTSGIVPDKLKVAKVIPIHKKGSKQDIGNYRPISLLTSFSKILEKMVYSRTR